MGYNVWFDEGIDPGSEWDDTIATRIQNAACFLAFISKNFLESDNCKDELNYARDLGCERIIIYLENVNLPSGLQMRIGRTQAIHKYRYSDTDFFEKVENVNAFIRTKTLLDATIKIDTNKILSQEHICFQNIKTGGFGIGYDKCLLCNGSSGWDPKQIYIENVDLENFSFNDIGYPLLEQEYQEFRNSDEFAKMDRRGNNQTRWMITELYQNKNVYISLKKTNWSRTSFLWNKVRDNLPVQQQLANHTFCTQTPFFPNSFCLHLIVETADEKLVCTKISNNKKNDYAYTIAATLGEQLEQTDFLSDDINNNSFVYNWCRRAFLEEFYFENDDYNSYIDESSMRVLGVTYEGDIYNFALPVYIKLKITYENLLSYMATNANNTEEFSDIFYYTKEDVLEILNAANEPETKGRFHPSTFLRLLLYLNYKDPNVLKLP